jgi:hypothetical protein
MYKKYSFKEHKMVKRFDTEETDLKYYYWSEFIKHLISSLWLLFDDQLVLQTMDSQRDDYFTGESFLPLLAPRTGIHLFILLFCGPELVGHSFASVPIYDF